MIPWFGKQPLNQVVNILKALANVKMELLTHSLGIEMLFKEADLSGRLSALHKQGVSFLVCENALRARGLHQEDLLSFAQSIPSAVAHLIVRQAEGWSYLHMSQAHLPSI